MEIWPNVKFFKLLLCISWVLNYEVFSASNTATGKVSRTATTLPNLAPIKVTGSFAITSMEDLCNHKLAYTLEKCISYGLL